MKVVNVEPGKPVFLRRSIDHKIVCCGCGFVHRFRFESYSGGITVVIYADERATARERRRVLGDEYDKIKRRVNNEERMVVGRRADRRDGDRRRRVVHPVVHRRTAVA